VFMYGLLSHCVEKNNSSLCTVEITPYRVMTTSLEVYELHIRRNAIFSCLVNSSTAIKLSLVHSFQ